ncbi:unnamed protein product [Paramecium sonneborni]|uniref:Uncharacterized protein n=1 Tax=Paramecium sonneborni TaxID=65129 RepID=A0A8S1QCL3_9CILI|nr:unnamed protein product [Paramecium sonneborni]
MCLRQFIRKKRQQLIFWFVLIREYLLIKIKKMTQRAKIMLKEESRERKNDEIRLQMVL